MLNSYHCFRNGKLSTVSHDLLCFCGSIICNVNGQGMDIPDVELVILYGAPENVNVLHQVYLDQLEYTAPC